MGSLLPASGKNYPYWASRQRQLPARAAARKAREDRDDLQLHPDLAISDLPASLPLPLSRRLAGKRSFARPCCSAAPSSRRWRRCSDMKIRLPPCSSNGRSARTCSWSIPAMTLGTACCSRACCCWSALFRTAGLRSAGPDSQQQIQFTRTLSSGNSFVAYHRRHRRAGRRTLRAGVEDLLRALSRGAIGHRSTRPAADLLLVDDRYRRSRPSCVRPQTHVEVQYLRATITEEQRQRV